MRAGDLEMLPHRYCPCLCIFLFQCALTSSCHFLHLYLLAVSGKRFCLHAGQAGCAKDFTPSCPPGASLTQCLMGVGVFIAQFPNTESCVLHLSPTLSCGIKLQPPTVETGLLTYHLSSAFLLRCYFPTLFPVFHELSEKRLSLRCVSQGSVSGGTQTKTCSNSAPIVFLSQGFRSKEKAQCMQRATAKWKRKCRFLNSWASTQYSPVPGGKTQDGECGLSPEEGSLRSTAC